MSGQFLFGSFNPLHKFTYRVHGDKSVKSPQKSDKGKGYIVYINRTSGPKYGQKEWLYSDISFNFDPSETMCLKFTPDDVDLSGQCTKIEPNVPIQVTPHPQDDDEIGQPMCRIVFTNVCNFTLQREGRVTTWQVGPGTDEPEVVQPDPRKFMRGLREDEKNLARDMNEIAERGGYARTAWFE